MFTRKKLNPPIQYGVEYKHIKTVRLVYILTVGLLVLFVSAMVSFVYTNIFQALEEANVIVVLQSELQMKTINLERLDDVQSAWEKKQERIPVSELQNPFIARTSQPIVTSSTTAPVPLPVTAPNQTFPSADAL